MLLMFCGSLPTSVPMLSVGLSWVTDIGQGHYRHGYRLQALVTDIGNPCRSGPYRCRYRCGGQPSVPWAFLPTSVAHVIWVDTDIGTDILDSQAGVVGVENIGYRCQSGRYRCRYRCPPTSVTDIDRCWTTSVPKLVYPRP